MTVTLLKSAFTAAILTGFAASLQAQTAAVTDSISGFTLIKEVRARTCHVNSTLSSINGKSVVFALHLKKNGKAWQTIAYGGGAKPRKRRDTLTVQFDGAVFYTRKVRLNNRGIFDLPHKNRKETARFVAKLTSRNNMVLLLRNNKDGLVVRLDQMPDVLTALQSCADSF